MISKHNNFYKIFLLNPNQIITNYCDWLVLTSVKKCNVWLDKALFQQWSEQQFIPE